MLTANKSGKSVQIARTVKPSSDLEKKSVAEKFELERRYYADQNIDWGIVTEKEIPRLLALNIEWIHSSYSLEATTEMAVEEVAGIRGNRASEKAKRRDYEGFELAKTETPIPETVMPSKNSDSKENKSLQPDHLELLRKKRQEHFNEHRE